MESKDLLDLCQKAGFDVKNHRLVVVTFDRIIYYVKLPEVSGGRYLEEAELRAFVSDYT